MQPNPYQRPATQDPDNLNTWDPRSAYYGLQMPGAYESAFDPNTLSIGPQFDRMASRNARNLADLRGYAQNPGDSPWALATKRKTYETEKAGKDTAAAKAAAMASEGMSDLAQTGGLTSGARERMTSGAARNAMDMSQDVSREANLDRLQVGVNDQQNKVQALMALPGMENQALSSWTTFKGQEQDRITQENARRQDYNMKIREMRNQLMMNERQAQATENAGKK